MKVLVDAASENLSLYLETLYDYHFEETKASEDYIEEGYITLSDLDSLSNFIADMTKHFENRIPKFILDTDNNELHLRIYDDWIE